FLMDCVVTPLKTLMGFSVHLNVQLKFYNLPYVKLVSVLSGKITAFSWGTLSSRVRITLALMIYRGIYIFIFNVH
ncbi:GGDEF domain-containing protein, partial [Limosilactobacillus fermentum]|nr:GGDEF domain-containing protein [Limosilactobacillus fermentum]